MVDAHKSETSIIQIQSKSSIEGTTVYLENILPVSIGKRAKMRHGDAQVFLVPTKKRDFR